MINEKSKKEMGSLEKNLDKICILAAALIKNQGMCASDCTAVEMEEVAKVSVQFFVDIELECQERDRE